MKNHNSIYFALIASFVIFATSCSSGGGDDGSKTYAQVLTDLGISTAAKDMPRTDVNKVSLGDAYNPLSSKSRTVLYKECDLYIAGGIPNSTTTGMDYLAEISTTGIGNRLAYDDIIDWEAPYYHTSVAADTNGDGTDDVITAYFNTTNNSLVLRQLKKIPGTINDSYVYRNAEPMIDAANITAAHIAGPDCIAIANGDVDGDGRDEIAVAYYANLVVFDDENAGFAKLAGHPLDLWSSNAKQFFGVAMADFDDDGRDETVAAWGDCNSLAKYCVFDDLKTSPRLTRVNAPGGDGWLYATGVALVGETATSNIGLKAAGIKTGDVDGDNIPDAIFCGQNQSNNYLALLILAPKMDSASRVSFDFLKTSASINDTQKAIGPLAIGDIDGNNAAEIAFYNTIYKVTNRNSNNPRLDYFTTQGNIAYNGQPAFWDGLCFGNVDDDVAQELVMIDYPKTNLVVWDYNNTLTNQHTPITSKTTVASGGLSLCLPSIDSRAAVLQYTGHEVQFTQPKIIALLAAPPFYSSLNGSSDPEAIQPALGNACTTFGKSTGSGTSSDKSNGFSFSVSAGFHHEAPLWGSAASVDVKATVGASFDWTSSQSSDITYSYAYTNYTDDDLVVFSVVPIDCYYYKVLNAPDPNAIGTNYMISLPREPATTSMDLTSYNALNGDCPDIDRTNLIHTIGVPSSYPTYSDMQTLRGTEIKGFYVTENTLLGTGTSTTEIGVEKITAAASTFGYEVSAGLEVETVTGGLLLGGSLAYNHSSNVTTSTTQGTRVSGTLANISSTIAKSADRFNWGIMAYPVTDEAHQQAYTVVTYWVTMNK